MSLELYKQAVRLIKIAEDSTGLQKFKDNTGIDFYDPNIQNLGNNLDTYTFNSKEPTAYTLDTDKINYNGLGVYKPDTYKDMLKTLAHETAHRNSFKYTFKPWNISAPYGVTGRGFPSGWEGQHLWEWPAIVNEWTYGNNNDGTISFINKRAPDSHVNVKEKVTPLRGFVNKDAGTEINPYYRDMFPQIDPEDFKSNPAYRYFRAPNEPEIPKEGPKRLIPDTPLGWWVSPSGQWERVGGDVVDADYWLKEQTPIESLPDALKRDVYNMNFLSSGPFTEERMQEANELRHEAQDWLSRLALGRKYRFSGDKTHGQLLGETLDRINDYRDKFEKLWKSEMFYPDRSPEAKEKEWQRYLNNRNWDTTDAGVHYIPIKDYEPGETLEVIQREPWWDPNMALQPIPIGLAGLQKKYSITPTLDEPMDWRTPEQYKAIIRDAQQCYDLQKAIDTYGPKDGGMGS